MNNIKDLLSRVDRVVTNSQTDTLTEIKNISHILEVDGKIATVLHFIHKDGHWNPNTLTLLEDIIEKLNLNENSISNTLEKKKEIKDFYLLNYLGRYWKEPIIKRLKDGKGLHYVNVFLRKVTSEMISDLQKLGLYPELSKDNLDDFQQDDAFSGGGPSMLIYKPVSEWLRELINNEELPLYHGNTTQEWFDKPDRWDGDYKKTRIEEQTKLSRADCPCMGYNNKPYGVLMKHEYKPAVVEAHDDELGFNVRYWQQGHVGESKLFGHPFHGYTIDEAQKLIMIHDSKVDFTADGNWEEYKKIIFNICSLRRTLEDMKNSTAFRDEGKTDKGRDINIKRMTVIEYNGIMEFLCLMFVELEENGNLGSGAEIKYQRKLESDKKQYEKWMEEHIEKYGEYEGESGIVLKSDEEITEEKYMPQLTEQSSSSKSYYHTSQSSARDTFPFPNGETRRLTEYGVTPITIEVDNGAVIEDWEDYYTRWISSEEFKEMDNKECKFPYSRDFEGIHKYMKDGEKGALGLNLDVEWANFKRGDVNTPGGGVTPRSKKNLDNLGENKGNWVSSCKYSRLLTRGFYQNTDSRLGKVHKYAPEGCCSGKGKKQDDWECIDKILKFFGYQGVPAKLLSNSTGYLGFPTYKMTIDRKNEQDEGLYDWGITEDNYDPLVGFEIIRLAESFINIISKQCKATYAQQSIPLPPAPSESDIEEYIALYPQPVKEYMMDGEKYYSYYTSDVKNGATGYSKAPKDSLDDMQPEDDSFTMKFDLPEWMELLDEKITSSKFLDELPRIDGYFKFPFIADWFESIPDNIEVDQAIKDIMKTLKKWYSTVQPYYHYIIDGVSFIAYLLCGVTAGIGCAISVAADILNASLYIYLDDDYYMAGMQMAFSIVPGGEGLKYLGKSLRPWLGPLFKFAWNTKGASSASMKAIAKKHFAKMSNEAKLKAKSVFTKEILAGMKTTLAAANVAIKSLFAVPQFMQWGLKAMWARCETMCRIMIIFLEMLWYDPGMPAQLLELLAGKNSVSDWLKRQPKFLLGYWNKALKYNNNFRGVITTTPYDCTGKMYVWDNDKVKSDKDVSIQQHWEAEIQTGQLNPANPEFTEKNVWAEWEKGWRPELMSNESIFLYHQFIKDKPELVKKYPKYLKNCRVFLQKMESKDKTDVTVLYLIFTELGFTEADLDEMQDKIKELLPAWDQGTYNGPKSLGG